MLAMLHDIFLAIWMYIVYGLNVGHAAEWYVSSQRLSLKKNKKLVEAIRKRKRKEIKLNE